jgi:hypothetical protein
MSKSELVKITDWNNARPLCKEFGYRYSLVFAGNTACYHRLAVKTWAYNKLGIAAAFKVGFDGAGYLAQEYELKNDNSDWFCGFIGGMREENDPYYIVFKEKKYRDFALLL